MKRPSKTGARSRTAELDQVKRSRACANIAPLVAALHLERRSADSGSTPQQDPDNSDAMIIAVGQGGQLAPSDPRLPPRRMTSRRTSARMPPAACAEDVRTVGRSARNREARGGNGHAHRDQPGEGLADPGGTARPYKVTHKMKVADIHERAGAGVRLERISPPARSPSVRNLECGVANLLKQLNAELTPLRLADWKTYLRFHLAHSRSPFLSSSAFVNENFDFYRNTCAAPRS